MFNKKHAAIPLLDKNSQTTFAEAYKSLRTNLDFHASTNNIHTILFVSPETDSNNCTFIRNLAVTLANAEHSVLLADFDLRTGTLTESLKIAADHVGISDILVRNVKVSDAIISNEFDNIDILPSGAICSDPAALFTTEEMVDLLKALRSKYYYVLLNAPCANSYTDPIVLSRIVDATVLLIGAGTTHLPAAQKCKEKLEAVNAKILGAVLTNYDPKQL